MWFEFVTNTECNWNCEYCTFDRVENKVFTEEALQKHSYVFDIMNTIRKKMELTVVCEGGEIGLVEDNDLLSDLFYKIGQQVIINTNGLFFESDRKSLYPYIKKVFYHVAEDAKTLFKVKKLDVPFEVIYGIVDDELQARKSFIEYNSHINIQYDEYEYITRKPKVNKEYHNAQLACYTLNPFVSIDLAREVLLPCTARGAHITIPLNEENLRKLLCRYSNFNESNDMCKTCYRTCLSNNIYDIMKCKQHMAKIL